jgi:hypothetical protein
MDLGTTMKKLTTALTGTALLALIFGLAGCGETAKVTDEKKVSTPEGTTTAKDTKEVKQSGSNPPPAGTTTPASPK